MRLQIQHTTQYEYSGSVGESFNEVRMSPLNNRWQNTVHFELVTEPKAKLFEYKEIGGSVQHFSIRRPHSSLTVVANSIVETTLTNPYEHLNLLVDDWEFYPANNVGSNYAEYLAASHLVSRETEALELAREAKSQPDMSVASYLIALNQLIYSRLEYQPGSTNVHSTLKDVFRDMGGVCQDFAHVMLAACRSCGIPSRYVSGYLYTAPGRESLHAEEATHAWVECLLPDGEWHGFDPTNNLLADDRYVCIHFGRDYNDVTPIKGVYRGAAWHEMSVTVSVRQMDESMSAAM